MQWSTEPFAGFSQVEPWLPLAADWEMRNVEVQRAEARSMLNLVRALLSLRRSTPCLAVGSYRALTVEGDVLLYAREQHSATRLVALNLDSSPKVVMFGESAAHGRIVLSTELDRVGEEVTGELALRADEGVIVEVNPA